MRLQFLKRAVRARISCAVLVVSACFSSIALAQVNVSATAGTLSGLYISLRTAFDEINAGTHRGSVVLSITTDITETATATLNASGTGNANYILVQIEPASGAVSISGNIAGPLIHLNGADGVTIDGRNIGGRSLLLRNDNAGAAASTVLLSNDASNNVITRVTLAGSTTGASSGVVAFQAGTVTGNDGNTLSNCTIQPAATNAPINAVIATSAAPAIHSGNSISNCHIRDYFNANQASAGILIGAGNSDWTVRNNRLFQSVARHYTSAATHVGISLVSGGNHLVSGNMIGYASSVRTGVYTMTSSAAVQFVALNMNVAMSPPSSVQANEVTAISFGTTSGSSSGDGIFTGISLSGGTVLVGTVTQNYVGNTGVSDKIVTTSTTSGSLLNGMHLSNGTYTVQNSLIGSLTALGATDSIGASVTGIRISGASTIATINGNTIGGSSSGSIRAGAATTTGSSQATGINQATGNAFGPLTLTNNTVQNITALGTGIDTGVQGIAVAYSPSDALPIEIAHNTIRNLQSNSTRPLVGNGQVGAVGILVGQGGSPLIRDNVISSVARTNTGVVSGWSAGITVAFATNPRILRNRIFAISHASTSSPTFPGVAAGILIWSGIDTVTVANNMIALGASETNNKVYIGIQSIANTPQRPVHRIHANTVHISGTEMAGANPSFGYLRGDLTTSALDVPIEFRNNLISVTRSGGTGGHYAIANSYGGTATAAGWPAGASESNVLNAPPATVGYWTSNQTLAGWRVAAVSDFVSRTGVPVTFVDPASDLHLNMGSAATFLESNGATLASVVDDFDQQARPGPLGSVNGGGYAPDIGADEFDGGVLDGTPPTIQYAPLATNTQTADRNVIASVADFSGVPTTGGLVPRIYFRRVPNAYVSQPCTLIGGTSANGQWDCPISHTLAGGVTAGDAIDYFVIAQDLPGNVGASPGLLLVASSVNTVTTPPSPVNQYRIAIGYSGDYLVGAGQPFTSLTNASGVFDAINQGVLVGNARFLITSDLLAETGAIGLNVPVEEGVGQYTITIQPSAGARVVSGSVNGPLIRLLGADRVRFEGSTTAAVAAEFAGGNPALRELTIRNTHPGTSAAVIHLASDGAGAKNNEFRNLNVSGASALTTLSLISAGGATPLTAGADNDGLWIENCDLKGALYGVASLGQSGNPDTGTVILKNTLNGTATERIRRVGLFVQHNDGANIQLNRISIPLADENRDAIAIALGTEVTSSSSLPVPSITNALVARNEILAVNQTSSFSAVGVVLTTGLAGVNTIRNNMISGVIGNSTSPDLSAGMVIHGVLGSSTRVLNNAVLLTGDRGATPSQMPSYAFALVGNDAALELKNNSFVNQQVVGNLGTLSYALGTNTSSFSLLDTDHNNYFASGANAGLFRSHDLGIGTGISYASLAQWQAAANDDANSLVQDPLHIGPSDLHLQGTSPLISAGIAVAGVSDDFDGQTRAPVATCMGADEIIDVDLQVLKTNDTDIAVSGQSTVYRIEVSNGGPATAQNAVLIDNLPGTLSNASWMCVQALSTAPCPVPDTGLGNLNSTITLPPGSLLRFDLMATANGALGGFVTNTATVSAIASQNDTASANNSATDQDTIFGVGIFANGFE